MNGFNATVFAYGATGSGKTHTMIGDHSMPGVMPQALQDLFSRMEERKDEKTFIISVSYLEIFNEMIRDLLVEGATSLDLRASANDTAVVAGLSQHKVDSAADVSLLFCTLANSLCELIMYSHAYAVDHELAHVRKHKARCFAHRCQRGVLAIACCFASHCAAEGSYGRCARRGEDGEAVAD